MIKKSNTKKTAYHTIEFKKLTPKAREQFLRQEASKFSKKFTKIIVKLANE